MALAKILADRAWQENTTMPLFKNLVNRVQQENTVSKLLELLNPIVTVAALVNTVMPWQEQRIVHCVSPVHIKIKMHKQRVVKSVARANTAMQMVHPAVKIARWESITVAPLKMLAHRARPENTTMPLLNNLAHLVQQENTVTKLLELRNPIVTVVALVNTVMPWPEQRIVIRVSPVNIKIKMHKRRVV